MPRIVARIAINRHNNGKLAKGSFVTPKSKIRNRSEF